MRKKNVTGKPEFYRLHCWKRTSDKSIGPCEMDDPEIIRVDFNIAGYEVSYNRTECDEFEQFIYDIKRITRLMNQAFDQGQRHRAALIRQAMECRL